MSSSSASLPRVFLFLLLAVACICAILSVWALEVLPSQARKDFGTPAPGLSDLQIVMYSARLEMAKTDLLTPVDANGADVEFIIESGETPTVVAERLQQAGLIANSSAFLNYLVYAGLDTGIQSNQFKLSPRLSAIEIARAIQDSTPFEVTFVILAGWRAEEIALALPYTGLNVDPQEFLQGVYTPNPLWIPPAWGQLNTLEGFLYPGEYHIPRNATTQDVIKMFLTRFDEQVTADIRQGFERQGLTLIEGVTMASMVEREAIMDEEMPMLASVFLNRIAAGMKFDSDPTVQYAIGFNQSQNTWWTNPLSLNDLQIESPYNTYLYNGFPPTPISNPGNAALQAIAYPAQSPYYYFQAMCDGSGYHNFARTFEEHAANSCY